MDRVVVLGVSGSGKSTVARRLADIIGTPCLELDAIHWEPDWQQRSAEAFQADIRTFVEVPRWIVEGNYVSRGAADIVWPLADTIVWLDPARSVVMRRVVTRTLRRLVTREVLWAGNRERLSGLFRWDPEKSIIRWSWTRYDKVRADYAANTMNGRWAGATVHRLRDDDAIERFLADAAADPHTAGIPA